MADIVLQTVDLDVFGGPSTLDVSVDFGQTGERGSRIYSGIGDPNTFLVGQEVKLFDLFINTNSVDEYYGWLYQYIEQVGNPAWVRILQLNPSQYSAIEEVDFSAGSTIGTGIITIPINDITGDTLVAVSDFIIRYNISGNNPISSNFVPTIVGTDLVITIEAIEYSGGNWADLSDTVDVHLFISYVE
jgi:hypothetical protein